MILNSFILILPILLLGAGGFLLTKLYHISQDTLVKVIVDFLMPMLIFHALCTSTIDAGMMIDLAGVTSLTLLFLFIPSLIYCFVTGMDRREFVPPVIFMNSGFFGIPLMKLWGGMAAMNTVVIFDQIQTLYIFTLGIMIITGGFSIKGGREMVKSPILWAVVAGFLFRNLGLHLPHTVLETLEFGGNAAPPLAALTLGVVVGETRIQFNLHLLAAVLLRTVGGFFAGLAACWIFGLDGMPRTIVIVASSLPSAVFTSVLPLRYGVKSDFSSTMVAGTTILSVITVPLAFLFAG
ncbi:MAG: AEC family transporter [Spirochaetales bacterium]|nr:AEC family transporter [Spirochaetales bacterium]